MHPVSVAANFGKLEKRLSFWIFFSINFNLLRSCNLSSSFAGISAGTCPALIAASAILFPINFLIKPINRISCFLSSQAKLLFKDFYLVSGIEATLDQESRSSEVKIFPFSVTAVKNCFMSSP